MAREIVLDTETTGLSPKDGHRIIEIACVEVDEAMPTGRHFHVYIDPERAIDAEAERVHGISNAFLTGKPRFADVEIVDKFLEFVGDATLVAHNAAFDRGFINAELERCGLKGLHESRWVDTLGMAQKKFPGMYNSLDALCKRYKISLASRDKHGALIDATLLASVYLELQGGRERSLDLAQTGGGGAGQDLIRVEYGPRPRPLQDRVTAFELEAHLAFLAAELKDKAVWLKFEAVVEA
jgi:DNA polymerase-3 subunit epsilon